MTGVSLKGSAELLAGFRALGDEIGQKALRPAVLAGSRVVRNRAKQIAEAKGLRKTGAMIANIAHKTDKNENGKAYVNIGVRHGVQTQRAKAKARKLREQGDAAGADAAIQNANDPYYWRFQELGTSKIAAKPFIRPAFEESQQAALDAMSKSLKDRLRREAKKAGLDYVG